MQRFVADQREVMRTNFKKWTVGSPIQAPLDALEILLKRHRFEPDQVSRIAVRVATNEATIVNNREIPDICLQHMLAVMLVDGTATFKSAHDAARMKDPAILQQRAKVQLVPDAELERLMPQRVGIVELALADGRTVSERVGNVKGTAENPMTREEVTAKARDLMTPVIGPAKFERVLKQVFGLETIKSVGEVAENLRI